MTAVTLIRTTGPLPQLGLLARLTANETAKGLQLMWRRRGMLVTATIMNAVLYLGFSLFVGGGQIVTPLVTLTLPALSATVVATIAAVQGSGGIAEEVNGGTLEQAQLGPAPPELQVLGRLGALAVEALVPALLLGTVFALLFGLHYHLSPAALIPGLLIVADALGYGLLLIGLTVRVASIGAITHVFNMAIQVFGGMLVPVAVFPHAVEIFTRFIPITLGVEVLNTTLAARPLSDAWADGTLPWLLVHVAVSLALGWAIYSSSIRHARREGGIR